MRVLLINGPPRCGKSTLAHLLHKLDTQSSEVLGFSYYLKRMVHAIYLGRIGWDLDPDTFDDIKGAPQDVLGGMSWRQAYIHYSEKVIKPLHGKEWFGTKFLETAERANVKTIYVPDSGFLQEAERVVRHVGRANVVLVRLHRSGCDFAGDSRSYIDLTNEQITSFNIENVTDDRDLLEQTAKALLGLRWS